MPLRLLEVPLVLVDQELLPPLVVATIVPPAPTAKQVLTLEQAMLFRF